MSDAQAGMSPDSFQPSPPQGGALARLGWLFSAAGRARLKLGKAFAAPEDAGRRISIADTIPGLLDRAGRGDPQSVEVAADALLFLTWVTTRGGLYEDAGRWLGTFQSHYPQRTERVPLRQQLMARLLAAEELSRYTEQAKAFVADPMVTRDRFAAPVLESIAAVYERVSPKACEEVASAAHEGFARTHQLQAALALCRSLESFRSAEEARAAASSADPDNLQFSTVMRADALILAARADEWSGDTQAMAAHASQALQVAPAHHPTTYWAARARLYQQGVDPAEGLDIESLPDSPERSRLTCQIALRNAPTFEHAEAIIPLLAGEYGQLDAVESKLTLDLLSTALTADQSWPEDRIAECARLCRAAEPHAGRLPWVQVSVALAEVRVEHAYPAAIQRLEREDVLSAPNAQTLARVARVLAGAPTRSDTDDPLAAIESAMHALLSDTGAADAGQLRQGLATARQDRLCADFPLLKAAADALDYALAVVDAGDADAECDLPRPASPWMEWLRGRAALLQSRGEVGDRCAAYLDRDLPALAWCVEGWWALYGLPGSDPPEAVSAGIARLAGLADTRSEQERPVIAAIRGARAGGEFHLDAPEVDAAGVWGAGAACDSILNTELRIESAYYRARRALREIESGSGSAQDAASGFAQLVDQVNGLPMLAAAWWKPAVNYWNAALLTRTGHDEAQAAFEALARTANAPQAGAQLALLALRRGDLAAAEQRLSVIREEFPAAAYARALLAARRGDADAARELLDSYQSRFGSTPSPYNAAAVRLRAAVEERAGNSDEAERLGRETVAANPGDAVAAARLARVLLRRAYETTSRGEGADGEELAPVFAAALTPGRAVAWSVPQQVLSRMIACQDEEIAGLRAEVLAGSPGAESVVPLLQVAAHRLLAANRPEEALRMLDLDGPDPDISYHRRTRAVLTAWRLLTGVWSAYNAPDQAAVRAEVERLRSAGHADDGIWDTAERELRGKALEASVSRVALNDAAACASAMADLRGVEGDPVVRDWRFLLQRAVALGGANAVLEGEDWQAMGDNILSHVPALWSPDREVRSAAASTLLPAVGTANANWNDTQRTLLRALCAWATGDDETFLDQYQLLEPVICELPVDGPSLWFGAASIWFQRKTWKRLLEGDLPDCVADLSDPRVRLLMGLAYARAAADDGQNKAREALLKIRQARNTLEPLLTRIIHEDRE